MDIANIRIASFLYYPRPRYYASPPIKTPTYSSIRGHRGTRSAAAPLTLLPITSTLGTAITTTTSASIKSIRVYLAITVSMRINMVYKWVMSVYSLYQRARISLYDTYAVLKLVVV